jgi:SAM-dependent methyltransferase
MERENPLAEAIAASGEKTPAEFDNVGANYRTLVDRSVRLTGESSDYFAAHKAEYIARQLAPPAGSKILDYGCGVGLLSRHLQKRLNNVQIDGFDPSQESLREVGPELLRQGTFTSKLARVGHDFGLIVLANVLHHVKPNERAALVREAGSRLAEGGRVVIFEHNPLNPLTRWAVAQCPFDEGVELLPVRETRRHVEWSGLKTLRRDYVVFFPRALSRLRFLEPSLTWCPLGAQYVVVAGKPARQASSERSAARQQKG